MSTGVAVAVRGRGETVRAGAMVVVCVGAMVCDGVATDVVEVQAAVSSTSRISKKANFPIGSILAQMIKPKSRGVRGRRNVLQ